MLTTSSFRADAALLLLIAVGCASATGTLPAQSSTSAPAQQVAPDAPQPAIAETDHRPPNVAPKYERIELASVRVRRIDERLAQMAGPQLVKTWRDPLAVEATTAPDLPKPLGASSPVLIINGQIYPDTWFVFPNHLIAFVPDRAVLRDQSTAEAMWIGGGEVTRSRHPVIFKPSID